MNEFQRKKALSDATRREHNTRHPSTQREGIAFRTKVLPLFTMANMAGKKERKYKRHGYNTPWWWTPDCLNDVAF